MTLHVVSCDRNITPELGRAHFVYALSHWETTLHCKGVCHWRGTKTKWSLITAPSILSGSLARPFHRFLTDWTWIFTRLLLGTGIEFFYLWDMGKINVKITLGWWLFFLLWIMNWIINFSTYSLIHLYIIFTVRGPVMLWIVQCRTCNHDSLKLWLAFCWYHPHFKIPLYNNIFQFHNLKFTIVIHLLWQSWTQCLTEDSDEIFDN